MTNDKSVKIQHTPNEFILRYLDELQNRYDTVIKSLSVLQDICLKMLLERHLMTYDEWSTK